MSLQPLIWKQKQTRRILAVSPWWECLDPIVSDPDMPKELTEGRQFKIGCIVQIGWLLENAGGVWFGVNLTAQEAFTDITATKAGQRVLARRMKRARAAKKRAYAKAVREARKAKK
jgi:hypothetical protein